VTRVKRNYGVVAEAVAGVDAMGSFLNAEALRGASFNVLLLGVGWRAEELRRSPERVGGLDVWQLQLDGVDLLAQR